MDFLFYLLIVNVLNSYSLVSVGLYLDLLYPLASFEACLSMHPFLTLVHNASFDTEIDLPAIGDIRNLSFGDVVRLLKQALDFLVGTGENDSVESCSGGLLGKELFGENVFTYKIRKYFLASFPLSCALIKTCLM